MRSNWRSIQLGDVTKWVGQYRPYFLLVAALTLVVTLLPDAGEKSSLAAGGNGDTTVSGNGEGTSTAETSTTLAGGGGSGPAGRSGPGGRIGSRTGTGATIGTGGSTGPGGTGGGASPLNLSDEALNAPDCDRATGRIKVPWHSAPPCVPIFKGNNGGATWQGVTATEITIAIYIPQSDPQTDAILKAAGVGDEEADVRQQYLDWIEFFSNHWELYGRKIKPVFVKATGPTDDDTAGRADAIDIATRIKAFAVWTIVQPPSFTQELAARGVIVFSYASDRASEHARLAPYYWSPAQMGISHLYLQTAEYVGKRLNNLPASYAGPGSQAPKRKFGLLYLDEPGWAGKTDAEFFEAELAKYGAAVARTASFVYDYSTLQTQARTIIAGFKEDGITSIILVADFLSPRVLTSEATNQTYFPEWIVTGSIFTDLNFYGRLYDQAQWSHAFGLSAFGVRYPKHLGPADYLYDWEFKRPPAARSSYAVLFIQQNLLFQGLHMAGPNLNPQTFRQGVFNLPPSGGAFDDFVLSPGVSYGRHGNWPFEDYVGFDDIAEIWWKADQPGKDELGNDGQGMYMFSDGGKRYFFGGQPTAPTKAFNPQGALSWLNEKPAREKPPEYENRKYRNL
ncbi:MAG TPA: hypothetical protein VHF47_02965 [Acidimicrobiales bacterium]|nr:hypothetical protein [Acidimicrobiales bacterium]